MASGLKELSGLILAGGRGTRMGSDLPKVLHEVAGKPMLDWVLAAMRSSGIRSIGLVIGEENPQMQEFVQAEPELGVILQNNRLGTGDAVAAASCFFADASAPPFADGALLRGSPTPSQHLLVCYGDVPTIKSEVLSAFLEGFAGSGCEIGLIGMELENPAGYGRIVCNSAGEFINIVEDKDAGPETKKIKLCNTGILAANVSYLFELLGAVEKANVQGEYYLTDVFGLARQQGDQVYVLRCDDWQSFVGVNSPEQLKFADELMRKRG